MTSHPFSVMQAQSSTLNIPILKFSYSTTSADRASPLGWTHLSTNSDLAVVLDQISVHETSSAFSQGDQRLRVLRGSDVLEQLNLNSLAREAAIGPSLSLSHNPKPHAAIIVKSPCLAVRYPMRNDQIRRFQIKFSSDSDYANAISIFNKLGCPITHSTVAPSHHPSSNRPFSSSSQASSYAQTGGGTFTESSGCSTGAVFDKYHIRPWSSSLTDAKPNSSGLFISSFNSVSATNANSHDQNHGRPHTPALTTAPGVSTFAIATTSSRATNVQSPLANFSFAAQRETHSVTANPVESKQTSGWLFKERPSTAPPIPDVDTLSQILPPKRELPFANPRATQASLTRKPKSNQRAKATLQPGGSSSFLIAQSEASSSGGITDSPSNTATPGWAQTIASGSANAFSTNYGLPRALKEKGQPTAVLNCTGQFTTTDNLAVNGPNLAHTVTALSKVDSGSIFTSSTSPDTIDGNNNTANAEPIATNAIPPHMLTERSEQGRNNLTGSVNRDDISPSDLSLYLSTPTPERSALVESWICRQLENDTFLALCQDVEGVWRRIAFGY
ncbi:hypothetical protein PAAG_01319 [Paracoccidioides lutzii Pb01]|uniref:Uncharacterized protein n=1 Tax=Paracoccidioides lutzii (strain ATCC MYA-826 / Pb01) TaxID=502779 RepID=C1GS24_PARBA|nr:hypothetical protein PAAG_01319 [Paracoccidioides lutzii Pb01]EEH38398.2 hypothetical protein PAAG_01319 [Paracoccidioides lutzii Pb01]